MDEPGPPGPGTAQRLAHDLLDLPDQARHLVILPKDGAPIATRRDREDAWLEVIQAVQEMATFPILRSVG